MLMTIDLLDSLSNEIVFIKFIVFYPISMKLDEVFNPVPPQTRFRLKSRLALEVSTSPREKSIV